ncbi:MAG: Alpha-mannosidase [uncultured Quadrisphaera sp.]|uniref:Alpha-mannosidase n=1 Tax=uncultured Quadrisphaera sp. TaxID=904978 RepID=A0A6J4P8E8_9ACTN|nr:MAG: Alpha-mannosidase [uncultured Quadrisphaera sp.]
MVVEAVELAEDRGGDVMVRLHEALRDRTVATVRLRPFQIATLRLRRADT